MKKHDNRPCIVLTNIELENCRWCVPKISFTIVLMGMVALIGGYSDWLQQPRGWMRI